MAVVLFPAVSPAPLVWRPGEGWSTEGGGGEEASSSREQLELGRRLEKDEEWNRARLAYVSLVRRWPFSFNAGEAQFKVGWCAEKLADFAGAFKAYQTCVEKYPASNYYEKSLERQFNIANLFLAGERQKIWKVPIAPSMDKAVEMYGQVIRNAPYGRYAAEAQFKIGLAHEKKKAWSEAIKAYQVIIDRYSNHDTVDDAHYQIGYAWMQAATSGEYDQGAADKAIDAFNEFLTRFPNNEKAFQARDNIANLKGRLTEGAFSIAKFYESQKKIEAAILYYNDVIQKDPESEQAKVARERIAALTPLKESGPPKPENLERLAAKTQVREARDKNREARGREAEEGGGGAGEFVGPEPELPSEAGGEGAEGSLAPPVETAPRVETSDSDAFIGPRMPEPSVE